MTALERTVWDVIVAGGGNAGLCAAIEAAKSGAGVLLLESAPHFYRGGNSRHTRNFRCMHDGPLSVLTGSYEEDEYFDDLIRVTKGKTDEALARMTIRQSEACLPWMEAHGVRFQPSLSGTLSLSRTNAFFLGGGKALVNAYYNTLEDLGVTVAYDAEVTHAVIEGDRFTVSM
jgi:tricarballylate dehydrogenase